MTNPTDNQLVRTSLKKTNDSGEQQTVETDGRIREGLGGSKYGIPITQKHGFSSHAPKGSHGVAIIMNGDPDLALMVGLEHKDHRPKNLAEGEAIIYNARNPQDYVHIKADGTIEVKCATLKVIASTVVIVECSDIRLGSQNASTPVLLSGGSTMGTPATKVKAE